MGQFTPVLALYDPFGVDVPLNFDITHSLHSEWISLSSLSIPTKAGHHCARNFGTTEPLPGIGSVSSSGDRLDGLLPLSNSVVHVSSPSFVDFPERSLRHVGRSADQAVPSIVSSGLVLSGVLVLIGGIWFPKGSLSSCPPPTLTTDVSNYGRVQLWMCVFQKLVLFLHFSGTFKVKREHLLLLMA